MLIKTVRNSGFTKQICFLDWYFFERFVKPDDRFGQWAVRGADFENRLDDLSPWPAQNIKKSEGCFLGRADNTGVELCSRFEKGLEHSVFAGYSLSGLFLLYMLASNPAFHPAGCMFISPSVWYEDFENYFLKRIHKSSMEGKKILLLWGEHEGRNKPVLRKLPEIMPRIADALSKRNDVSTKVFLGDHHDFPEEKISYTLEWFFNSFGV